VNPTSFPWTVFVAFLTVGLIALFLSLPFPPKLSLLLPGIVVLVGVVGIGLLLAKKIGLRVSMIEETLKETNGWLQWLRVIGQPVMIGAVLGAALLFAIRFLFVPLLPPMQSRFITELEIAVWKRGVIAFDSAVLEELIFRLFMLSLLAWLLGKVWHSADGLPTRGGLWLVNVLIAIGFGLAHLPNWASLTPLTPPVVAIVILLNGIGGFTFGWLYFSQGLEAAMLAHFAADVVLHVVGPGFLKT
jgi:CAAX prenyl protease-like protein